MWEYPMNQCITHNHKFNRIRWRDPTQEGVADWIYQIHRHRPSSCNQDIHFSSPRNNVERLLTDRGSKKCLVWCACGIQG